MNSKTDKPNYQNLLEKELARITQTAQPQQNSQSNSDNISCRKKPSLLLHACCAPCSSYVIEYLASFFNITIFYYNPNIHPQAEYERRLCELSVFLQQFKPAQKVQLSVSPYDAEEYFSSTHVREEPALQTETERGERCRRCYYFRMKKTFAYAAEHGFDYITTTLSISPYKDSEKINSIGKILETEFAADAVPPDSSAGHNRPQIRKSPQFLYADFKKKNGFKRSLELSAEYGLYRQDYCGCIYSFRMANSHKQSE